MPQNNGHGHRGVQHLPVSVPLLLCQRQPGTGNGKLGETQGTANGGDCSRDIENITAMLALLTENVYTISVMKNEKNYAEAIRMRIKRAKAGTVFVMADFADVAPNNAANRVIARLVEAGQLLVVLRGVYQKPKISKFLKENVKPTPDEVARAMARKNGWTIRPDGDAALNQLGLSTQVPAAWNYLSDGPYKKYTFSSGTLVFKHTANRLLGNLSWQAALVVQALRALGQEHVSTETIRRLADCFDNASWEAISREAQSVPDWIRTVIAKVMESRHE